MGNIKFTKKEVVGIITKGLAKSNDEELTRLTRTSVKAVVVDLFLEEVKNAIVEDKTVEFRGFGTFELRRRKEKDKARNPRTGELVKVDAHGVVNFRPGKELKKLAWDLKK